MVSYSEAVCWLLWIIFMVADLIAYHNAKYPQRANSWIYKLPGGGFVALYKFGRDRD
jgi:hypothetical protein